MTKIYQLVALDLRGLGAPMGREQTSVMFRRYYKTPEKAINSAEEHYKNKIKWLVTNDSDGNPVSWNSGDLRYIQYTINLIKVE